MSTKIGKKESLLDLNFKYPMEKIARKMHKKFQKFQKNAAICSLKTYECFSLLAFLRKGKIQCECDKFAPRAKHVSMNVKYRNKITITVHYNICK